MSMRSHPLVSAIVPAYNAEPFIRETLCSVLSQTYQSIEVLVVDDGSTDRTPSIVEEMAEQDPRIKLFRQKNQGVAAARNLAIAHAKGAYIAPVDADDIWYPTKIEKQVQRMEEYPEAGCAYTWSVSINEKGKLLDAGSQWDLEGKVYEPLVLRNFVGNASVPLFRTSALGQVGGYNEKLRVLNAQGCEDWEICLRVAEHYDYCVIQEYLVGYRCYSQSMSYNHEAMGRSYELVMEEVQRRHPEIKPHIHRWSRSLFYLYLTNKSNVSGDLRSSYRWLLKAIKEDPMVLTMPWVFRCFVNRSIRMAAYAITRSPKVWAQLNSGFSEAQPALTFEQIIADAQSKRTPHTYFERILQQRWITATNNRSVTC
ncbi:MAG: glycosyltransferase family 2 protein [Limisphaerales bacterium]